LRRLEEGSQYSSDMEDVRMSEYLSTDNEEAGDIAVRQMAKVITMNNLRGSGKRLSTYYEDSSDGSNYARSNQGP